MTSSLQFLDLSDISFSGQLPESISNLKSLNSSIPASLWNLTQITDLAFSSNSFRDQIPSSVSNLAKLNRLLASTLLAGVHCGRMRNSCTRTMWLGLCLPNHSVGSGSHPPTRSADRGQLCSPGRRRGWCPART
ncbi:hypothetical protein ACSBR1_023066 [Camellia fascicularis]